MRTWQKVPRGLKWTLGVLAAVLLALVLFVGLFDWNLLRGPIAGFVSKRIDREVTIERLDVRLFRRPAHVAVEGLRIGNPDWAGGGHMVDVRTIDVDFQLWPLLIGHINVERAAIVEPKVYLVREAEDRANWQFGGKPAKRDSEPLDLPLVRNFILTGGHIRIADQVAKLTFDGTVEAAEKAATAEAFPFRIVGGGELNAKPFKLEVRGGPLVNIERDKPYAIDADVQAGTTKLSARGSITEPFNLARLQFNIEASGDDLASLYYLTGLALPNTPPYSVKTLMRRDGTRIALGDFAGKVGDSDISGDLTVDTGGERPRLTGELISKKLDLDDLAPARGAAPQAQSGETISADQRKKSAAMSASQRLFPDAELQVDRVRSMDADVKFRAASVTARKIPIKEVGFHLKLEDGVLTLNPVSFVLPQGRFDGDVRLDARADVPQSEVDFKVTGVQLGQFKPKTAPAAPLEGSLLGRIHVKGSGNSIAKFVATGDGSVTAIVPDAEIREAFAELMGINVARGLGLLLSKDQQQVRVRCGVADFQMKDGKLTARNLIFDTENVLITGKGELNLAQEKADLEIKGQPKKLRFLRLRTPVTVSGPLRKPSIGVKGEDLVKQGGAAALLSALAAPLAAVLAFVDPGLAKDANCSALVAEAAPKTGAP